MKTIDKKYRTYYIRSYSCPICNCFISGVEQDTNEFKCINCGTTIKIDYKKVNKNILDKLEKAAN